MKQSPTEGDRVGVDGNMGSGVNGLHCTVLGRTCMRRVPRAGEGQEGYFSLPWREGGEGGCGLEKEGVEILKIFPDRFQLLNVSSLLLRVFSRTMRAWNR